MFGCIKHIYLHIAATVLPVLSFNFLGVLTDFRILGIDKIQM